VAAIAWVAAVGTGFSILWRHEGTPGALLAPPVHWPRNSLVALAPDRLTLVTFAHPNCPCTHATLAELGRLVAQCRERFVATVVFCTDPELGDGWQRAANPEQAAHIPGVLLRADPLGATTRVFGARTSGFTVVYSPSGALLYHGGITGSRGHEGDNPGAAAVRDLALTGALSLPSGAVYGCELFAAAEGGDR